VSNKPEPPGRTPDPMILCLPNQESGKQWCRADQLDGLEKT
jgi:hypothetical protein